MSLSVHDPAKRWVSYFDLTYWKRERKPGWLITVYGSPLGIVAADNHRPPLTRWYGRVLRNAFRGSGPVDRGHDDDAVPEELYNSDQPVGFAATMDLAAHAVLTWGVEHRAPLLGYPRHPDVVPALRKAAYRVTMFDVPPPRPRQ